MLSRRLAVIVPTLLRLDVSRASMAAWPSGVDLRCVQGDSSDWAKRAVIVPAVYYEWAGMAVPAWLLADGRTVYRYQRLNARRPCYCANAGFEAGVYLSFIAAHYERLPAAVVFVQADWFDPPKGGKSPRGLEAPRFDFWQMRCAAHMHGAHAAGGARPPQRPPWADYLPLGQRNGYWPPRVVTRSSLTYSRAVPLAHFGACLRHMLHLAGLAVPPAGGLNLTFYASSNFVASRRRLRSAPHAAWRALAHQFVAQGVCVPPALLSAAANATEAAAARLRPERGCEGESCCGRARADRSLCHTTRWIAKMSLGHGSEVLQHAIFGGHPVEHAPLSSAGLFPSGPDACAR